MEISPPALRPGDHIISTYMPHATDELREEARETLRRLARAMVRIEMRRAREWHEAEIRKSEQGTVDSERDISPLS